MIYSVVKVRGVLGKPAGSTSVFSPTPISMLRLSISKPSFLISCSRLKTVEVLSCSLYRKCEVTQ